MGRIQRMKQGSLPSAVVATPAEAPSLADDIVGALGEVAKVGYGLAVKSEAAEMKKIAAADRVKKGIVDDISFGKRSTEFVVESGKALEQIYKDNASSPSKAPDAYAEWSEGWISNIHDMQENDEVKAATAQWAVSAKNVGIKKAFAWSSKTQTENAKTEFQEDMSLLNSMAENAPNIARLEEAYVLLEGKQSQAIGALGSDADEYMKKQRVGMAFAYASNRLTLNPIQVLNELEDKEGNALSHLTTTQRNMLKSRARSSAGKASELRGIVAVQDAVKSANTYGELYTSGNFTGKYRGSEERRIAGEKASLIANMVLPQKERESRIKELEESEKDLKIMGEAAMNASNVTAEDMEVALIELESQSRVLFIDNEGKGATDLPKLRKFQRSVLESFRDGEISKRTFSNMLYNINVAFPEAMKAEWDKGNEWYHFANEAQDFGVEVLNNQFKSKGYKEIEKIIHQRMGVGAKEMIRQRAILNYVDLVNTHIQKGQELTESITSNMAKKAFGLATGTSMGSK